MIGDVDIEISKRYWSKTKALQQRYQKYELEIADGLKQLKGGVQWSLNMLENCRF